MGIGQQVCREQLIHQLRQRMKEQATVETFATAKSSSSLSNAAANTEFNLDEPDHLPPTDPSFHHHIGKDA